MIKPFEYCIAQRLATLSMFTVLLFSSADAQTRSFSFVESWMITNLYFEHQAEYERVGLAVTEDRDVTTLYCDDSQVYVETTDNIYYEGEGDRYTTKYIPICRFNSKVVARRTKRGVRFPFAFFEVNSLMVYSFLERRSDADEIFQKCESKMLKKGSRSACDIIIDNHWSVTYRWEPF